MKGVMQQECIHGILSLSTSSFWTAVFSHGWVADYIQQGHNYANYHVQPRNDNSWNNKEKKNVPMWYSVHCCMTSVNTSPTLLEAFLNANRQTDRQTDMKALLYPYCTCVHGVTSLIFHIYETSWAFKHSDPFSGSPGSHSQVVSCSVGITSSCSLLAFPFSVSLMSSYLHWLCSLVS